MAKQRQKPGIDKARLCRKLKISTHGAVVGGGQFENFRKGWAVMIMGNHARAHYYRRSQDDLSRAISLCQIDAPARWLYGPGNYTRCALCARLAKFVKDD